MQLPGWRKKIESGEAGGFRNPDQSSFFCPGQGGVRLAPGRSVGEALKPLREHSAKRHRGEANCG